MLPSIRSRILIWCIAVIFFWATTTTVTPHFHVFGCYCKDMLLNTLKLALSLAALSYVSLSNPPSENATYLRRLGDRVIISSRLSDNSTPHLLCRTCWQVFTVVGRSNSLFSPKHAGQPRHSTPSIRAIRTPVESKMEIEFPICAWTKCLPKLKKYIYGNLLCTLRML